MVAYEYGRMRRLDEITNCLGHPSALGYPSDAMLMPRTHPSRGIFLVDEMGARIDALENSIGELMAQAGIEEEGEKRPPTAQGTSN